MQETKSGPFEEKVIVVRYDPCRQVFGVGVMMVWVNELCGFSEDMGLPRWSAHEFLTLNRSADIALVAGGSRKRWIIATENMQAGDIILNSDHIGRMAGERWPLDVCGL